MIRYLSIREIQLAEYDILCKVVDLLEKENIIYVLAGGTLLGSIRHQGFIPWDDDIDILVPRRDYERLKTIIQENGNCINGVSYRVPGEKDSFNPFIKAMNMDYICDDERLISDVSLYLWIDIFPLDHFPDNTKKHKQVVHKLLFMKSILYFGVLTQSFWKDYYRGSFKKQIKYYLGFLVYHSLGKYVGISRKIDSCARRMDNRFRSSKHVGDGAWPEGEKDYFEIEWFFPAIKKRFENREFYVPKNYDAYLKHFYGDYMTPPPENCRTGHLIKVYKKER